MDSIPVERKQMTKDCTADCSRSSAELKLKNMSRFAPELKPHR